MEPVIFAVDKTFDKYHELFGRHLKPTRTIADSPTDPICRAATQRDGFDWCAFTREVGPDVTFSAGVQGPHLSPTDGTGRCVLEYLLNISGDRAYFLASFPAATSSLPENYVLVEVPRQSQDWFVYRYVYRGSPLPYCKADPDGTEPWSCWAKHRASQGARLP